jgi:hypothetical protein
LWENLIGRSYLKDLDADDGIVLKQMSEKGMEESGHIRLALSQDKWGALVKSVLNNQGS